jgi:DNA polymerase III epsilon subunit-like protein
MSAKEIALRKLEVLAIDCQATHSNPAKGHLLEIGWVKTRASDLPDVEQIVNKTETYLLKIPRGAVIPRAVLRVTGLRPEDLKLAHPLKTIWQRFSQTAEQTAGETETQRANLTIREIAAQNSEANCPAVIHFIRYEEPFLRSLHKKFSPQKEFPLSIVCTHEIVKRLIPGLPRKSLRAVAGYFGQSLPEYRRSLHHVSATALIWHHVVKLLEDEHGVSTFLELQEWLRQPAALKEEFYDSHYTSFDLGMVMAKGAQFWKDRLDEQAAEEHVLRGKVVQGKAESDIKEIGEEKEDRLELEMQEMEEETIPDTWTSERIVKILKSIIRLGAFQFRRAHWFCRLNESSLVWTPLGRDAGVRNLIVIEGGALHLKDCLSPSERIPVPSGHAKSLIERQKSFDLSSYDRMRVLTTEIRRILQEGRSVEICLHPDIVLRSEQLKKMLLWV